jgi:hypothetical protein
MAKNNVRNLRALSILIAASMAVFFAYNWNDIYRIFLKINLAWALTGFICHSLNYLFRGMRLKRLTGSDILSFFEALNFSIFHGVLSYLMPMQSGDASLPILLKATGKFDLQKGVAVIAKLRVLDVSVIGILSFIASCFGARMISPVVHMIWSVSSIILSASFFMFQYLGKLTQHLVFRFLKLSGDCSEFLKLDLLEFAITGCIWTSIIFSQFCMIRSLGLDLMLPEVIFISTIQFPLQMLPLQGFANSGNHEGGWVAALVLMGFSADAALDYALASHGVLIVYIALIGLVGAVTSHKKITVS